MERAEDSDLMDIQERNAIQSEDIHGKGMESGPALNSVFVRFNESTPEIYDNIPKPKA